MLAVPDELLGSVSAGMHVVVLNGQPAAFELIKKQFEMRQAYLSVIDLPESGGLPDENHWQLPQADEAEIKQMLKSIAEKNGAIDGFLYLMPAAQTESGFDAEKAGFLFAKHLSRWYRRSEHPSRKAFVVVTQLDGQMGFSGEGKWQSEAGALNGLVKTLHQEWVTVFCRVIDFSPEVSPERMGKRIFAEWTDVDRGVIEVGVSNAGRFTVEFEEILAGESEPV